MKKRLLIFAVILIAVFGAAGGMMYFKHGEAKNTVKLNLYFLSAKESTLVAEKQTIKLGEREDIVDKAVEALIKGSTKNVGVIDKEATVNGIIKNKGYVTVDFSRKFLVSEASKNALAVYAVTKTLCQLPGVSYVKVTVNSQEVIGPDGKVIGFLAGDDINVGKDVDGTENKYVTLYFADKESRLLKKEIRAIKMTDSQPIEQYILNGLIEGPKSTELEAVLSQDTSVISVQTTDGTCFVNFASGFATKNSGSEEKQKKAIYSIVNSLTELDNVTGVQFLIDGKKSDALSDVSISGTVTRDESMIANE